MPSEQWGMSPKKGKNLQRPLDHLKMWNDFVCQFRPVHDNVPTILLTRSLSKKGILTTSGYNKPVRSPDLSPPDYSLWTYLKSVAYEKCSNTMEDQQGNIPPKIDNIPVDMLENVIQSFRN